VRKAPIQSYPQESDDLERSAASWRHRLIEDWRDDKLGHVIQAEISGGRVVLVVHFQGERRPRRIAVGYSSNGQYVEAGDERTRYRVLSGRDLELLRARIAGAQRAA
jgi:hypothetical protein